MSSSVLWSNNTGCNRKIIWELIEASLATLTWAKLARFSWGTGDTVSRTLQNMCGFLRPVDWLKIYSNLVVFFFLFFLYNIFFIFFLSGHFNTSNLVEQTVEITIQCKCEIRQHHWLSICFTLNNTKSILCFQVSLWKKSSQWVDFLILKLVSTIFYQIFKLGEEWWTIMSTCWGAVIMHLGHKNNLPCSHL